MKIYITFGQEHIHRFGPIVFDKDSVAEVSCADHSDGREIAFGMFGYKFAFSYDDISKVNLGYFPRGIIKVSSPDYKNQCSACDGSGSSANRAAVSWTTIKEIYTMTAKHLSTPAKGN